jgi:hypothetical protein
MMAIPSCSNSLAVADCGLMRFPALRWLSVIESVIVVLAGSKKHQDLVSVVSEAH